MSESHVEAFYSRHPISRDQILARLRAARGHLDGLVPEELYPYDQDHYGGLDVVDALAARAAIVSGSGVADFCAGLAGPARYLAHRYGAIVTCIEINPNRAPGAADLTRRVGLDDQVRVLRADVMQVPLRDGCMDAVVSQEALLHVPDKRAALAEAHRILRPGGRLAFTDWTVHRQLEAGDAEALWRGIAAQALQSSASYREMLQDIGFQLIAEEDLTEQWGDILETRFAMYCRLREEAVALGTPSGDDEFYRAYRRLVDLVKSRVLGGARFTAAK